MKFYNAKFNMILFKTNFAIIFFTLLLIRNGFSVDDYIKECEILQIICRRNLTKHFRGGDVYRHGQIAIENLSKLISDYKLNADAKGYYESFNSFLEPGQVPTPTEFFEEYSVAKESKLSVRKTSGYFKTHHYEQEANKENCLEWIHYLFTSDLLQVVQRAFYNYNFNDMKNLRKNYPNLSSYCHMALKFYFRKIRDLYGLRLVDFKGPIRYCEERYGPNASTSTGGRQNSVPHVEIDLNRAPTED